MQTSPERPVCNVSLGQCSGLFGTLSTGWLQSATRKLALAADPLGRGGNSSGAGEGGTFGLAHRGRAGRGIGADLAKAGGAGNDRGHRRMSKDIAQGRCRQIDARRQPRQQALDRRQVLLEFGPVGAAGVPALADIVGKNRWMS